MKSRRWPTRSTNPARSSARAEALVERRFGSSGPNEALRRLAREAPTRLPRRRGHRRMRARRGPWADLRRTLRESARNDGEVMRLGRLKRRARPRKMLLLIDVSGSMKLRSEDNLRLAHTLVQATPNVEVFTFGTRLTRVTRALRLKRREQALAAAAHLVSDWDGGTRIGDALQAFLAVPAVRRLRPRRRGRGHIRRAGARRSHGVARRGRQTVAARLAAELADAACGRLQLRAADRGADRHSPFRR